jgi:pyruvate/2-oxoacid:ferredoxin oxidoreductase alpha subunit
MVDVNRALSGPLDIHCDHSDTMGARDTGLIQLYSENSQEVYDNTIKAFRIAEHPDVQLPATDNPVKKAKNERGVEIWQQKNVLQREKVG